MRRIDIRKILKKCLILSIPIGVFIGLLFGAMRALLFVDANRYIELGMYSIAFDYSLLMLNKSFHLPLIIAVLIGVVTSLVHVLLLSFLKDRKRVNRLTLGVAVFLTVFILWLLGGYFLNRADWYPNSTTFWGILFNLLFTFMCTVVGFLMYKFLPASHGSFARFFNFKLVIAVAILILISNGYYYYNKFFNVREGTNVVFITVDTLRADHLGYNGYGRNTSPNVDVLARDGVVFSEAFAQWPQTTPSFASMLTSTYGPTNGVIGDTGKNMKLDDYFVLLPEVLKDKGYNTMGIVTNLYLASQFGFGQGIEDYTEAWRKIKVDGKVDHEHVDAEIVTKDAVNWLKTNHKKGKFFMWVHYLEPHADYAPPEPYNQMYVGDALYDGTERINLIAPDPSYPDIGGVRDRARLDNNDVLDYYVAQYDGEVRYVDKNIGALLDEIKRLGLYDNTLIIFTSDHGESLGEHNYFFWHGRLPYDDCLRVPFIIKFPSYAEIPSKHISQTIGLIDLLPTTLDFLGLSIPKETEGKTLMPLIRGEDGSATEYVYSEAGYEENYQRIIRRENWKLIFIPDNDIQKIMNNVPFELYDVRKDPNELNNLINVETNIADALKEELFKWVDSTNIIDGVSSSKTVNVDKEMEEKLRSLGYIQ